MDISEGLKVGLIVAMRPRFRMATLAGACFLLCVPVHGQIAVPPLQVPQLPVQTPDLDRTVDAVTGRVGDLREVRRLRIRNLLRTNRAVLEADPRGAPMLRNEVTAFSPTDEALARRKRQGSR